MIMTDASKVV